MAGQLPITVVIVDDHEMILDSLVRILDRQADINVVATAGTVARGMAAIADHSPDVIVMDYQLPDGDGAEASRLIIEQFPLAKVVMLTGSDPDAAIFEASSAGCAGFVNKTAATVELVRVVRSVAGGASELPGDQLGRLPRTSELVVHYQPIVDLASGEIVGFEALARWEHPTQGLLLPMAFIPLAERTSFILTVGDIVRDQACRQAAKWTSHTADDRHPFVSVNVSGRELADPGLIGRVTDTLDRTGLEPSLLMLEITETFLVQDLDSSAVALDQLKHLGVRIALDDFGTGYSSLGYLRRFPIDVIKLDKSFTDELPHGERALRLLESVGHLATDMGAVSEAEGIENQQQADCLTQMEWSLGQGYFFSPPVEAASATSMLGRPLALQ